MFSNLLILIFLNDKLIRKYMSKTKKILIQKISDKTREILNFFLFFS